MFKKTMRRLLGNSRLQFGLLLVISCALIYGLLSEGHDWGGDFSQYIMQAQSVSEWNIPGFMENRSLILRGPTCTIGEVIYPWGFPILLAPFYKLFGLGILGLKMIGVICYVLFLVVLYHGFARYHSRAGVLGLTAAFALNPAMLTSLNHVLSDIPFLLFSTLFVILIGRVIIQRRPILSYPITCMLLGVILTLAFLIRNQGVLLIVLAVLTQIISFVFGKGKAALDFSFMTHRLKTSGPPRRACASLLIRVIPYLTLLALLGLAFFWNKQLISGGAGHLDTMSIALSYQTAFEMIYNFAYYAALPKVFFGSYVLYAATIPLVLIGIVHRS